MSRWFRHYAGMMRDEKLVRAAVRSKQPVERVVWVWGAILESAAEINDNGRYELDLGEAAYFLRCDESDLGAVIDSLVHLGRLLDCVVAKWGDRQYVSDGAAERQRRYRERVKGRDGDDRKRKGDVQSGTSDVTSDVTPPSRDGAVTAQETETEEEGANAPNSSEPEKSAPSAVVNLPTVSDGEVPIFEADVAEWREAFPAVDVRQQLAVMRSWLLANPTKRKTKRGMRKFVVSWLDRRQNDGRPAPMPRAASPPKKVTLASMWRDEGRKRGILPNDPTHEINGCLDTSLGDGPAPGFNVAQRIAGAGNG